MRLPIVPTFLVAALTSAGILAAIAGGAVADGTASSGCPDQQLSQPFVAWGDAGQYALVPNGDFENGLDGWSVSGGAGLVSGAEPWQVTDANETQSLELPAGSSASSPAVCVDADDPSVRFFAVNNGDPASLLSVGVSFTTLLGLQVSLPIDVISSDGSWQPSPQVLMLVNALALDSTMPVQFTFTPIGAGDWQIDDLYLDPWGRS
jgi:hypothetical protein